MSPPATRLRERATLGWIMVVASGLCAVAGGVLGTAVMWFVAWGKIGYPSLIVAGLSATVIGGFVGFLASSFLQVSLRAWSEALADSRPATPPGRTRWRFFKKWRIRPN
jgi:hypothetical protein